MYQYSLHSKKVFVAGHRGMVGNAIMRRLIKENCQILTIDRNKLDLRDQYAVHNWMKNEKPQVIFVAAAKVGGILANDRAPVDFLSDNLLIASNIINYAHKFDVERLLYLGSSCIYPKLSKQPIIEDYLLTGALEPTNQWYAIAKIAGLKLVQAYRKQYGRDWISAMPTNLYGPGDNYDLETAHVLPALIRKFHEAKVSRSESVVIWGSGDVAPSFYPVLSSFPAVVLPFWAGEAAGACAEPLA